FSDLDLDLAQVQSHVGTRGRIDDPVRERVRNPCPITRLWRKTLPPLGSIGDLRNALEGAVDRPIDDPGAVPEDESQLARSGQGGWAPSPTVLPSKRPLEQVDDPVSSNLATAVPFNLTPLVSAGIVNLHASRSEAAWEREQG